MSTLHELEKQIEDLSDSVSAKLNCRKLEDLTHDLFKPKGVTKDVITEIVLNTFYKIYKIYKIESLLHQCNVRY